MNKSARRRTKKTSHTAQHAGGALQWIHRPLLGVAVTLIVATPLIPSEAAVFGSHAVLVVAWLLLTAVWLFRTLLLDQPHWHIGPAGFVLLLFLAIYSLSGIVMIDQGHGRPMLNTMWVWISFGLVFLAARQLVRGPIERRALVGVLLAQAVGMSAFGIYQTMYIYPQARAKYAANPERELRLAGEYAPPGSAARRHFEDRLASTEPIGPFALTNSLAGVLAPCLVLAAGLSVSFARVCARNKSPANVARLVVAAAAIGLLVTCLILTKSRSGFLAAAAGLALLAVTQTVPRSWLRWRYLALGLVLLVVVGTVATLVGGLDRQVLTEAPKSVLYRLQYWRASAAMIADHPLWGCGPGSFKDYYTQYKLPEASETIADPHNFLFEIAASGGIPALVCFMSVGAAVLWQVRSPSEFSNCQRDSGIETGERKGLTPFYLGIGCGYLLAWPAAWAVGQSPSLDMLWVALPATLLGLWMLQSWIVHGAMPVRILLIAAATLLVNLLAAGGIGYPGVAGLLWILAALAINGAESSGRRGAEGETNRAARAVRSRYLIALAAGVAVMLFFLSQWSMYQPVLAGQQFIALTHQPASASYRVENVVRVSQRAANADRWWAEPCEMLADAWHYQWIAQPTDRWFQEFRQASVTAQQRNPHSSSLARRQGDWFLDMYAQSKDPELLNEAVAAYSRAVGLYPNSAELRAQLAWACVLAGQTSRAVEEAGRALDLDRRNPHEELKLRSQTQALSGWNLPWPAGGDAPSGEGGDAEQIMREIRKL